MSGPQRLGELLAVQPALRLDVSKIESGKVVLNLEKFALNDVVSSVDAGKGVEDGF